MVTKIVAMGAVHSPIIAFCTEFRCERFCDDGVFWEIDHGVGKLTIGLGNRPWGREIDHRGREIDHRGREIDHRGWEIDHRGREIDHGGREIGQEIGELGFLHKPPLCRNIGTLFDTLLFK